MSSRNPTSLEKRLRIRPSVEEEEVHKALRSAYTTCALRCAYKGAGLQILFFPNDFEQSVKVHYIECSVTTFIYSTQSTGAQGESMRKTVQWPPALYRSCQDAILGVTGALKHVCGYNETSNLFPVHAGSDALGLCVSTSGTMYTCIPIGFTSKNLIGTRSTAVNILLCSFFAALTQT